MFLGCRKKEKDKQRTAIEFPVIHIPEVLLSVFLDDVLLPVVYIMRREVFIDKF